MIDRPGAPQQPVVGVILAGGRSRRMGGGDKALLTVGEQSLLERIVARLGAQTAALVLNANGDARRFASFGLPIIADGVAESGGPLFGLLAGMRWAERNSDAGWIVTAPSDAPFLPDDLVARLADGLAGGADIAVCRSAGRLHPIIGLWPIALADPLEAWLAAQPQRAARAWLATRRTSIVDFAMDGAVDPFFNVNTLADLAAARQLTGALS